MQSTPGGRIRWTSMRRQNCRETAERFGDKEYIVFDDERMSFAEAERRMPL